MKREKLDALKEKIRSHRETAEIIAICGITIEEKPEELPSRPGYKWAPHQVIANGPIVWTEEESEDKSGTEAEPILFTAGMRVYPNYYYTDGEKRYVCIMGGEPMEIGEGEYFTEF